MEDYKWILYIIAAVYFILKSRKKKVVPPAGESRPFESVQDSPKPVTFEDLLREIQQSKSPAPKQELKPVTKSEPFKFPKYEDYDDDLEEEAKDLEKVDYSYKDQDEIYATYEKAKQEAFNRPSLEVVNDKNDGIIRFGSFKEYDQPKAPSMASIIAEDFRNAENIKKAFIMSEILNRKY